MIFILLKIDIISYLEFFNKVKVKVKVKVEVKVFVCYLNICV